MWLGPGPWVLTVLFVLCVQGEPGEPGLPGEVGMRVSRCSSVLASQGASLMQTDSFRWGEGQMPPSLGCVCPRVTFPKFLQNEAPALCVYLLHFTRDQRPSHSSSEVPFWAVPSFHTPGSAVYILPSHGPGAASDVTKVNEAVSRVLHFSLRGREDTGWHTFC